MKLKRNEKVKPIPGYVDRYSVTTQGRVYSHLKDIFLKPKDNGYAYFQVQLVDCDGKRKHHKIHKLVAITFIGQRPSPNYEICHLDDDTSNNSLKNLEYQTRSQNRQQCISRGRANRRSVANFLTEPQVRMIKDMHLNQKLSQTSIAELFNCSRTHVCQICNGKSWKHVVLIGRSEN